MAVDLHSIPGYHHVAKDEAKKIMEPHIANDGYYVLRPSADDSTGTVVCTICVSKQQKVWNYRVMRDLHSKQYYINNTSTFPSIPALIHFYRSNYLNAKLKTQLLYPVYTEEPQEEYVELTAVQSAPTTTRMHNGGMDRPLPPTPNQLQPRPQSQSQSDRQIQNLPGMHCNLAKGDVPDVLKAFFGHNGAYVVRPSASSKGQLTISLVCEDSILNFKINHDPADNKYYVAPKKRFNTVQDLLEAYKSIPLRSKARAGAKIFLTRPISPAEAEKILAEKKQTSSALPPPWQEFFDEKHKRPYYYNPTTQQTIWERPKPVEQAPPTRSKSMKPGGSGRPLPKTPDMSESRAPSSPRRHTQPIVPPSKTPMRNRELPLTPGQERACPPLPQKDGPCPPLPDKNAPPLPDKGKSPIFPRGRGGNRASEPNNINRELNFTNSSFPPRGNDAPQGREPNFRKPVNGNFPELPPKTLPAKDFNAPPLPFKESQTPPTCTSSLPPLPQKANSFEPPPLPAKEDPPTSSLPSLPPKEQGIRQRPKMMEYSDVPPLPQKDPPVPTIIASSSDYDVADFSDTPAPPSGGPPPPPAPPPIGGPPPPPPAGGPPPPPPIPAGGIPAPPPPSFPPVSPNVRRNTVASSQPDSEASTGGRPFTAGDLMAMRGKLKQKTVQEEDLPARANDSGLQGVFDRALKSKMGSIRAATGDSDDDTDVEEVDDDDWDD